MLKTKTKLKLKITGKLKLKLKNKSKRKSHWAAADACQAGEPKRGDHVIVMYVACNATCVICIKCCSQFRSVYISTFLLTTYCMSQSKLCVNNFFLNFSVKYIVLYSPLKRH